MFTILCALIRSYIRIVQFVNWIVYKIADFLSDFVVHAALWGGGQIAKGLQKMTYVVIADGLCPDLENWYFAPLKGNGVDSTMDFSNYGD